MKKIPSNKKKISKNIKKWIMLIQKSNCWFPMGDEKNDEKR
jgi:hypothetical protein